MYVCMYVCLSVCRSVCVSVSLYVCMCVCLSVCLSCLSCLPALSLGGLCSGQLPRSFLRFHLPLPNPHPPPTVPHRGNTLLHLGTLTHQLTKPHEWQKQK